MSGTDRPMDDAALERLFQAARRDAALPDADFLARLTAEALAEQPRPGARAQSVSGGFLARMLEALGGWPSVAGLAAAGLAGVWICIAAPGPVGTLMQGLSAEADGTAFQPVALAWLDEEG